MNPNNNVNTDGGFNMGFAFFGMLLLAILFLSMFSQRSHNATLSKPVNNVPGINHNDRRDENLD